MRCFAMISSCSLLFACSKHCFLRINSWHAVNFTKSGTCYLLLFCHACLNLLMSELAVAQCSSFVKHHEWIPAMYFVVMFECCSISILMHLDGYLLFIAHRCHICFACHFQPCIRFRWSLYRFQAISSHLSNGTLGFPSWGHVPSFLCKSCICTAYRIPHMMPCSCVGCLLCCVLLSGVASSGWFR